MECMQAPLSFEAILPPEMSPKHKSQFFWDTLYIVTGCYNRYVCLVDYFVSFLLIKNILLSAWKRKQLQSSENKLISISQYYEK